VHYYKVRRPSLLPVRKSLKSDYLILSGSIS
jgi:hypothetical protein